MKMLRSVAASARCLTRPSVARTFCTAAGEEKDVVIPGEEMLSFMVSALSKSGADESHARQLAEVLLEGDRRGHYSHGLNRLDMYIRDLKQGVCRGSGTPEILSERAASAWVDGRNLLGPVVGNFCVDVAVRKAKEAGVGWVSAKGSNHFGIAGWYSMRAMKEGCIGLSFSNTSPIMYPSGSATPSLGTNPLSVAAAGVGGDEMVIDMATTTVAIGKVELAARKAQTVPASWGVAKGGKKTTNPADIIGTGGLLPLGGDILNGGYKGYGMAAIVELFCGLLAGAHWGPHVRKWMSTASEADLGQCFIAVDPSAFAPGFADRMQAYMDTMRALPQSEAGRPVDVHGDMERRHLDLVEKLGGIPYHPNQVRFVHDIASQVGVPAPKSI